MERLKAEVRGDIGETGRNKTREGDKTNASQRRKKETGEKKSDWGRKEC